MLTRTSCILAIMWLSACKLASAHLQHMQDMTPEETLSRFLEAYRSLRPLEVSLRIADMAEIGDIGIDETISAWWSEPDPVIDPDTNIPLWIFSSMEILADPAAHRYFMKKVYHYPDLPEAYQACTPSVFWQAENAKEAPAMLSVAPEGQFEDTHVVLRARRHGRSTGWLQGAQGEYYLALIFALWHLPNVRDLAVNNSDPASDSMVLSSESLGLSCDIDTRTGELVAITFHSPSGAYVRMEAIDFFPDSLFPARAPSMIRREHASDSDAVPGIHLLLYDGPPKFMQEPADSLFDWRTYREAAVDQARGVLFKRDGGETPWRNEASPFAEQFLRRSDGNASSRSATNEGRTADATRHPQKRNYFRVMPPIFVGTGIALLVTGAVLAWRRGR